MIRRKVWLMYSGVGGRDSAGSWIELRGVVWGVVLVLELVSKEVGGIVGGWIREEGRES